MLHILWLWNAVQWCVIVKIVSNDCTLQCHCEQCGANKRKLKTAKHHRGEVLKVKSWWRERERERERGERERERERDWQAGKMCNWRSWSFPLWDVEVWSIWASSDFQDLQHTEERFWRGQSVQNNRLTPEKRSLFFFEILSDLNQAVPNHLADESQTR